MPVNKNALIRYRTIDKCLVNRQRRWTLKDIIEACIQALQEYEGKTTLSQRTVQLDIQAMRSGKLGYEAPIIVVDRKYYTYSDPSFSIARVPVSKGELEQLKEAVLVLKQFRGFQQFDEIEEIIFRLEEKMDQSQTPKHPSILLELNDQLRGLSWLSPLHQYIVNKQVLQFTYHAFHQSQPLNHEIHPYLLKEYNNRWYVIGYSQVERRIKTFSIDRIKHISPQPSKIFIPNTSFDPHEYFKYAIGVTVHPEEKPIDILFYTFPRNTPYLKTKPLHPSQECVKVLSNGGALFKLHLIVNFELINTLMREGPDLLVVSPIKLRNRMMELFDKGGNHYKDKALRAQLWKEYNDGEDDWS